KFGKAQGMKPDNAGTEQRSGGKIAEAFRNRIDELFRSDDGLCVSAISSPAREKSVGTKVFAPSRAKLADAAGAMQPRNSDASARRIFARGCSRADDASDHLMSWNDARQLRRKLAFDHVEIGAADTTSGDLNQDFIRLRLWFRQFAQHEWMLGYGVRTGENHRFHSRIFAQIGRSDF